MALFGLGVLEVVVKEEVVEDEVEFELVRCFLSNEEEIEGREDDCESLLRISCKDA